MAPGGPGVVIAPMAGHRLPALSAKQNKLLAIMDGLEATRQICSIQDPPLRPYIVAMTANAMKEDRDICLAAGMDDYLNKPIRPETIKVVLERAFAKYTVQEG